MFERCAALDVHKKFVTVCARIVTRDGELREFTAEFQTMAADLLALRDWLKELGVTEVAMEATGVYWKPVYYALEGDFELLLVNARHVKNVPGRKTDSTDAQWLCQLLECGLLRASFVPPKPIRALRELTPVSQVADQGALRGGQPVAEGARGRRDQALERRHGRARRLRPADAPGAAVGIP
jgi:transposase